MNTTIQSKSREKGQQSTLTQLRSSGYIPAIVYGYKTESTPIAVNERNFLKTLRITGRNGVMKLNVDGKDINVVLNDYQQDALKGEVIHADFLAINMTEELEVDVQVNLVGAVKDGGVVQQPNRELKVKVKPSDIPESFDIDISTLAIGETISVADIREKYTFEIVNEDDYTLVTSSAPRTDEELEELEGEATEESAEPEVIGEKEE